MVSSNWQQLVTCAVESSKNDQGRTALARISCLWLIPMAVPAHRTFSYMHAVSLLS